MSSDGHAVTAPGADPQLCPQKRYPGKAAIFMCQTLLGQELQASTLELFCMAAMALMHNDMPAVPISASHCRSITLPAAETGSQTVPQPAQRPLVCLCAPFAWMPSIAPMPNTKCDRPCFAMLLRNVAAAATALLSCQCPFCWTVMPAPLVQQLLDAAALL